MLVPLSSHAMTPVNVSQTSTSKGTATLKNTDLFDPPIIDAAFIPPASHPAWHSSRLPRLDYMHENIVTDRYPVRNVGHDLG